MNKNLKNKLYVIIFTSLLFYSCGENNVIASFDHSTKPESFKDISYKIPVSDAVFTVLDVINSTKGNTRSASSAEIENIEVVKTTPAITRSLKAHSLSSDTLLYIINFKDGGFGVAAADSRTAPIYAYSDKGRFNLKDTCQVLALKMFIKSAIHTILYDINNQGNNPRFAERPETRNELLEQVGPFMDIEWSQNNPYNKECVIGTEYAKAGCVAIATAQICAYNKYPHTFEGYNYDWNTIYKIKSSSDQYTYPDATNQLAHFIRRVGLNVGMKYGVKESGAKSEKIPGLLRKMGYTCSDLISYSDKGLVESLKAGHPVYQCGFDKESDYFIFQTHSDGHAWVVDGYRYEMLNIRICRPRRGEMDCDSEKRRFLFVRNNYGWGGLYNGWYQPFVTMPNANGKRIPTFAFKPRMITNIHR